MSALDVTKPMRTKGFRRPQAVTLIALFGSDEAAEQYHKRAAGNSGSRQPGQTMLIALNGDLYGWYYPDGRYNSRDPDCAADLENYQPPVVVKHRRVVMPDSSGYPVALLSVGHAGLGIVEFTVTDGKLTGVELVS